MVWDWLASLLSSAGISLTFDNGKRAGHDLNSTVTRTKETDKSKRSTTNKIKSKDTYHAPVVHAEGPVTIVQGDVNLDIRVQVGTDGKITPEGLAALAPFNHLFEQKQIAFVAEQEKKTISDIKAFEDDPDVRGLLKFFRHRLKPNDFLRLRTGLYLKYLGEAGRTEEVKTYWRQVTVGQRQRDRRIIELASAGYFTTFFRPLYKLLMKANAQTAEKRFSEEFEAILEDMRFAIFISSNKSIDDIYDIVIKKAIRNIKYGSTTEIISLHAAGARQVSRVMKAVDKLREIFPVVDTPTTEPRNTAIIRIDIAYRKNNLDEDVLQDDLVPEAN